MVNGDKRKRRKYLQTTKSQLLTERQVYLPSIISSVTNNKIELETARLTSLKKTHNFNPFQSSLRKQPTFGDATTGFPPK